MRKLLFIPLLLLATQFVHSQNKMWTAARQINGMQANRGFVAAITSQALLSTNWKCFRPPLLILKQLIRN
jgi:hypothetical protein